MHNKAFARRHLLLAGLHLSVAGLLLAGGPVLAHREKTLFTTIHFNARSGMLEVIHRTYAHDVEHTLGNRLQSQGGLDTVEARARVSLELCDAFTLWDEPSGEQIPLQVIGAELDGEFFYIYQEAAVPAMPQAFRVRHLMLRNHWPDMSNFVNVKFADGVASLLFDGSTDVLSVSVADQR